MIKELRILIGIDFTDTSENALNYVRHLFDQEHNLTITYILAHAFKPMVPYSGSPGIPVLSQGELEKELRVKLEAMISELQNQVGANHRVYSCFTHGSMNKLTQTLIAKDGIDLVVMGSREKSAFERMTFGTNTLEVASSVNCPVLAVPKEASPASTLHMALAHDMMEHQDMEMDNESVALLETLVGSQNSRLEVLQIFTNQRVIPEKTEETRLHRQLSHLEHKHFNVVNSSLTDGIMECVDKQRSNFLILTLRERSFIEQIFHSGDTEKMVYHSQIPVLIIG